MVSPIFGGLLGLFSVIFRHIGATTGVGEGTIVGVGEGRWEGLVDGTTAWQVVEVGFDGTLHLPMEVKVGDGVAPVPGILPVLSPGAAAAICLSVSVETPKTSVDKSVAAGNP